MGFDKQNPSELVQLIQQRVSLLQAQEATLQQHHKLDISVQAGGGITVNVHYRDQVPDLFSRFSDEVRKRARYWFLWPTPYERQVWKATKTMPRWARETVRQHILHERAVRIDELLKERAERQAEKQKAVQLTASRQNATEVPQVVEPRASEIVAPERPTETMAVVRGNGSGSALSSVAPPALSLTERIAAAHGTQAVIPPKVVRHHGRDR